MKSRILVAIISLAFCYILFFSGQINQSSKSVEPNWTFEYDSCFVWGLFHDHGDPYLSVKVCSSDKRLCKNEEVFVWNTTRSSLFHKLSSHLCMKDLSSEEMAKVLYPYLDSVYKNDLVLKFQGLKKAFRKRYNIKYYSQTKPIAGFIPYEVSDGRWEYAEGYISPATATTFLELPGNDNRDIFHWYFVDHKIVVVEYGESPTLQVKRYKKYCP